MVDTNIWLLGRRLDAWTHEAGRELWRSRNYVVYSRFTNLETVAPPRPYKGLEIGPVLPEFWSLDLGTCEPMSKKEFKSWMWFEAVDRISKAQRLHQQFFALHQHMGGPAWEPPADVLETETEVLIFFAVPGVDPDGVDVVIDGGTLIVSGRRVLPDELRTALIHQLELPQGRFARRISLPPCSYDGVKRQAGNGCLLISLQKTAS